MLLSCATEPSATVAQVVFSTNDLTLTIGDTATVVATPIDRNGNALAGRTITWIAADPTIASVSASGLVTAVASGNSTITATCDGVSDTLPVTVNTAANAGRIQSPSTPVLIIGGELRLADASRPDRP
jgi:uncharacterized protein YjdB